MTTAVSVPPKYYQPAPGLLRLSQGQVNEIRRLYGLLSAFLADNRDAEARLVIVVKRGKIRFGELELPAGDIPARGVGRLGDAVIQQMDAKLSSLCAYTEQAGGEARLILTPQREGQVEMKMALSQELAPAR